MNARHLIPLTLAGALVLGADRTAAQSLAQRVAGVDNGTVRLSFSVRPGVTRDGDHGTYEQSGEWEADVPEQARMAFVALDVTGHQVTAARMHLGGHWLPGGTGTVDLGRVSAVEAAKYLLELAARTPNEQVASRVLPAAALADSAETWPALYDIARNHDRPERIRRDATFWLSQAAADAATRGLADLADDGNAAVRRAAVFGLSQRPHDEGLPALMNIARTHPDRRVRRDAIFWIGQSHDPRAVEFLRQILVGS